MKETQFSAIAYKLISGEIDTSKALYLARKDATGELKEFIENELNGYTDDKKLPNFRILNLQVVLDLQWPFGNIERGVEFSMPQVEKNGFSINTSYFYEDYNTLKNSLNSLSSNSGLRVFDSRVTDSISSIVKREHPDARVIKAAHKFQKYQVQSILDKIKGKLIEMLQDQTIESTKLKPLSTDVPLPNKKTVFISYGWEDETHNDNVLSFVNFLRENGYDARMDKSLTQTDTSLNLRRMMHEGVYNSDKVIIILSKKYKEKADKLEGGVGEEIKIIQEDISKSPNKYILVSFESLSTNVISQILPNSLSDREVLDLKKDQDENHFSKLFAKLNSTPLIDFSEVGDSVPEVKPETIKPFKL